MEETLFPLVGSSCITIFTNLLAKLDCSVAIDLYKSLTRKESLTGECPDKKHYQHQWLSLRSRNLITQSLTDLSL